MTRARTLARITLALGALGLPGCKLLRRDSGRLVVREGTAPATRILAEHVAKKGVAADVVNLGASDALPYPNGAGMLALDASGTGFLREQKGRSGIVLCKTTSPTSLFAIDDAGDHVLFRTKDANGKTETVHFMDTTTCGETTLVVRYAYRGDVARDGSEAAVGAFPTSCTEASLDRCPVTLYRLRAAGSPVPMEIVRGGARANYQPRYFPDGKLVFQTTELDTACDGTIDACRHDLVSIPLSAGPGASLTVIRKGAIAAGVSADGKKMAYLAYTGLETGCHARLPCKTMTLRIGDWRTSDDSKDVSIATASVSNVPGHPFSVDGRWIAFATGADYEPKACHVDGTSCVTFAGTHLLGWMK